MAELRLKVSPERCEPTHATGGGGRFTTLLLVRRADSHVGIAEGCAERGVVIAATFLPGPSALLQLE